MAVTHGINTSKKATSVSVPVTVASGVHFVVGTAPVQMVGGKVNEVIMLNSYEEAVQLLGYSDDWQKYGLCMEVYFVPYMRPQFFHGFRVFLYKHCKKES